MRVRGRICIVDRFVGWGSGDLLDDRVERCRDLFADTRRQRGADHDHTVAIGVDGDGSDVVVPLVSFIIGLGCVSSRTTVCLPRTRHEYVEDRRGRDRPVSTPGQWSHEYRAPWRLLQRGFEPFVKPVQVGVR